MIFPMTINKISAAAESAILLAAKVKGIRFGWSKLMCFAPALLANDAELPPPRYNSNFIHDLKYLTIIKPYSMCKVKTSTGGEASQAS